MFLSTITIRRNQKISIPSNSDVKSLTFSASRILSEKEIRKLKPCDKLVLLAHPDDESCFFGFIANFLKNKNDSVQVVYSTSGQKGRDARGIYQRYDERIGPEREKELIKALNVYGMKRDPMILSLMDGETHYPEQRDKMAILFQKIIDKVNPKEIYTFDPVGMTGHSDHIATSSVVSDIFEHGNYSKRRQINLWQVAFTEKSQKLIIDMTKATTHMFTYARHSILRPDRQINITESIPKIIEAFDHYKTQFPKAAVNSLREYFYQNPFIDLILKNKSHATK